MMTYVGVKVYLHNFSPRSQMEKSGWFHASAALSQKKESLLPIG
jgi:hypothetical protein